MDGIFGTIWVSPKEYTHDELQQKVRALIDARQSFQLKKQEMKRERGPIIFYVSLMAVGLIAVILSFILPFNWVGWLRAIGLSVFIFSLAISNEAYFSSYFRLKNREQRIKDELADLLIKTYERDEDFFIKVDE